MRIWNERSNDLINIYVSLPRRNDRFLSCLPSGLALLASHQIAGRGRGSNTWVSPAGCLQFSIILRLPQSQASKIVFVQYLFGLAVVEAVRRTEGYEDVKIVLKWPNDVYGDVGQNEYKKIGGILVNSSYMSNEFSLVVGTSVFVANLKFGLKTYIISRMRREHQQP